MRGLMLSLLTCMLAFTAGAASLPYDTGLDANAALRDALSSAKAQNKNVLIVFGANWDVCFQLWLFYQRLVCRNRHGRRIVIWRGGRHCEFCNCDQPDPRSVWVEQY